MPDSAPLPRPLDQAITNAIGDGIDHVVNVGISLSEPLVSGGIESTRSNGSGDPGGTSAGVENNRYARIVMAALEQIGVGHGAKLLLVGHSFGADTALDLVADPDFVGRYEVTQVVATGYNHGPQLNQSKPPTGTAVVNVE